MASAFAHAMAAVAIGRAFSIPKPAWKFWLLGIVCAVLPDADVIGFKFGIAYESFWGHRGFTHSLVFAAILAVVVLVVFYRKELALIGKASILWSYFFMATASHSLLDAMTTGGEGVAFFSPFDNGRYFYPGDPLKYRQ